MTIYLQQGTHTATNVSLADVTPTTGPKWVPHPDYPGELHFPVTTLIRGPDALEEGLYLSPGQTTQDWSVNAQFLVGATFGQKIGVAYCVDRSKFKTFYLARFASHVLLELLKIDNGGTTTLGSATCSATSQNPVMYVRADKGVHRVWCSGIAAGTITATDTSLGAGHMGLYVDGRAGTNTNGPHVRLDLNSMVGGINDGTALLGALSSAGEGSITGFSGYGTATLSPLTVEGSETIGGTVFGEADVELPLIALDASVTLGIGGVGAGDLPLITLAAAGVVSNNEQALGSLTVSGSGVVVILGAGDATLPLPTCDASGKVAASATAALLLPALTVEGAGITIIRGTASATLPLLRSEGEAVAGLGAAGAITLSALEADGTGFVNVAGTLAASLPLPYVEARAIVGDTAVALVLAMNTENAAVTEYSGWSFDSFAELAGVTYGLGAAGIVALGGAADGTGAIAAYLRTGKDDGGTDSTKRPTDAYVAGRMEGGMSLTVTAKKGKLEESYDYDLPLGEDEPESRKTDLGRGFEAVYLQYELANVSGADFAVDKLTVLTQQTGRRA